MLDESEQRQWVAGSLQDLQAKRRQRGQHCAALPDWQHVHASPEERDTGCNWPGGRAPCRLQQPGQRSATPPDRSSAYCTCWGSLGVLDVACRVFASSRHGRLRRPRWDVGNHVMLLSVHDLLQLLPTAALASGFQAPPPLAQASPVSDQFQQSPSTDSDCICLHDLNGWCCPQPWVVFSSSLLSCAPYPPFPTCV